MSASDVKEDQKWTCAGCFSCCCENGKSASREEDLNEGERRGKMIEEQSFDTAGPSKDPSKPSLSHVSKDVWLSVLDVFGFGEENTMKNEDTATTTTESKKEIISRYKNGEGAVPAKRSEDASEKSGCEYEKFQQGSANWLDKVIVGPPKESASTPAAATAPVSTIGTLPSTDGEINAKPQNPDELMAAAAATATKDGGSVTEDATLHKFFNDFKDTNFKLPRDREGATIPGQVPRDSEARSPSSPDISNASSGDSMCARCCCCWIRKHEKKTETIDKEIFLGAPVETVERNIGEASKLTQLELPNSPGSVSTAGLQGEYLAKIDKSSEKTRQGRDPETSEVKVAENVGTAWKLETSFKHEIVVDGQREKDPSTLPLSVKGLNESPQPPQLVRSPSDSALCTIIATPGTTRDSGISILELKEVLILFKNIERSAGEAEFLLNDFRDGYVSKVFKTTPTQQIESTRKDYFAWLVEKFDIPKRIDEKTPQSFLTTCTPSKTILLAEDLLQKLSLANRLVSDDFEAEPVVGGLDLNARFADAYYAIEEVLSNVRKAKLKLHIGGKPLQIHSVDEFVPKAVQEPLVALDRLKRDWIIYRDTINVLQYLEDVFKFFQKNAKILKLTDDTI